MSIRRREPNVLFRDFFVHLDFNQGKFELPASEIWVASHAQIDNLTKVLNQDITNIKELIDLEPGLRFALQKLKELITTKFEYLANPFYL